MIFLIVQGIHDKSFLSTHINVIDYELISGQVGFVILVFISSFNYYIYNSLGVLQYRKLQTWHATIPPKSFLLYVFVLVRLNI